MSRIGGWALQMRVVAGLTILLMLGMLSGCDSAPTGGLRVSKVDRFDFIGGESSDTRMVAEGLSGIVYVGDNQYLVVSDLHARIHRLSIEVDPTTGRILSAEFGEPLALTDSLGDELPESDQGPDREGIALDPATDSVWIANEQTGSDTTFPSISQHSLETGAMMAMVPASPRSELFVFSKARTNQSLESLTRNADKGEIWTANEQALTVDGGLPTRSNGAVVRLQRLDSGCRPMTQYAYVTAPLSAMTASRVVEWGISGVVDLLALSGDVLLVLERAVVGGLVGKPTVRIRIYEVNRAGATDISRQQWADGLIDSTEPYVPVEKRLLVELTGKTGPESNFNFEGLALGPRLESGERSLILIADNGTGTSQTLYALRLVGLDQEPPTDL